MIIYFPSKLQCPIKSSPSTSTNHFKYVPCQGLTPLHYPFLEAKEILLVGEGDNRAQSGYDYNYHESRCRIDAE